MKALRWYGKEDLRVETVPGRAALTEGPVPSTTM